MPRLSTLIKPALPFILFLCFVFPALAHTAVPRDSIRTEVYKNQKVIIYRVSSKETMYSISRKYGVSPREVIQLNEGHQSLRVGDEIRIPLKAGSKQAEANAAPVSTRTEQSYTVEKKETLYSIARKFGMQPKELEKINALSSLVLKPGQILTIIPYTTAGQNTAVNQAPKNSPARNPVATTAEPAQADEPADRSASDKKPAIPATGLYIVQPGETAFAIATRYGIPVARLQDLNHLQNNQIHSGQTLKLTSGGAEPASKAKEPADEQDTPAPKQNPAQNHAPVQNIPQTATRAAIDTPKPGVKPAEVILPAAEQPATAGHITREYKEEGVGLWLNNNDLNQARSVGLHRSAPVGTIVKVTNPMSRKSIFIKVVGSFPETADSKDALIVISKSAAELIGALDARFRVELSYAY